MEQTESHLHQSPAPTGMSRRTFLQSGAVGGVTLATSAGTHAVRKITADSMVRVGLVGREGHPGEILNSLAKLQKVELAAYAGSGSQDDIKWIRDHPAYGKQTHVYSDFREMLEKEDLHVVGSFMPYFQNAEVSIQAASKGIHVVSEKPAATTLNDLERLESVIRSSGVRYSILLNMRTLPIFLAARTAVQQGLIGEPVLLYSRKSYKWGDERPAYYRERRTYGGTIPWVGIHCIDYMRWVSGLNYRKVAAHHGNNAHPAYPGCEDQAGLLFTLDNMGTAVAHLDFLRPESAPTHGDDRLRIAGKEGVLEVVETEERVGVMNFKGKKENLALPPPVDFFGSFVAELRGEGTHLVSNQEAISITRVCLKARDAADRGEWVPL